MTLRFGNGILCDAKSCKTYVYRRNKNNCVYTAKSGGYVQLFIHKRCTQFEINI